MFPIGVNRKIILLLKVEKIHLSKPGQNQQIHTSGFSNGVFGLFLGEYLMHGTTMKKLLIAFILLVCWQSVFPQSDEVGSGRRCNLMALTTMSTSEIFMITSPYPSPFPPGFILSLKMTRLHCRFLTARTTQIYTTVSP